MPVYFECLRTYRLCTDSCNSILPKNMAILHCIIKSMDVQLFDSPEDKEVVVRDINGVPRSVPANKLRFRVSAYAVILNEDKDSVLVHWNPEIERYSLPGGEIRLGESIEEALSRELAEETGLRIQAGSLIEVDENFFEMNNQFAHAISIFYNAETVGDAKKTEEVSDSSHQEFKLIKDLNEKEFGTNFFDILKYLKASLA